MRQRNVTLLVFLIAVIGTCGVSAQAPAKAEERLKQLKIVLPTPPVPVANYVPAVRVGNLLYLSGSTPREFRPLGKVGKEVTVQQGYQAAREVGMLLLANTRGALGSLDRVKRVVKVLGMVNSADGFGEQPAVVNGFSDLMVEVFGDAGKHARSSVGVAALPGNASVEIEVIFEVE